MIGWESFIWFAAISIALWAGGAAVAGIAPGSHNRKHQTQQRQLKRTAVRQKSVE